MGNKRYLGDGVYAVIEPNRAGVWLTTENGIDVTNRIFMEPEVIGAFLVFINKEAN